MYIIDFDGTLVDVWKRYYSVFNDFWCIKNFSLSEYKFYKRIYEYDYLIVREKVGLLSETNFLEYKVFKKEKIEDIDYLMLDDLLVTKETLQSFFFRNNDAIILTIRNNKENIFRQFDSLNINFLNDKVIPLNSNGIYTKVDWVKKNISGNEEKIVIGDSETDLMIGEIYGTTVYLVETGLRDPYKMIRTNNAKGYIIPHIKQLLGTL